MANIYAMYFNNKDVLKIIKNGTTIYDDAEKGVNSGGFTITNSSGQTSVSSNIGIDVERPPLTEM